MSSASSFNAEGHSRRLLEEILAGQAPGPAAVNVVRLTSESRAEPQSTTRQGSSGKHLLASRHPPMESGKVLSSDGVL